eukprot:Awhi_evm1s12048
MNGIELYSKTTSDDIFALKGDISAYGTMLIEASNIVVQKDIPVEITTFTPTVLNSVFFKNNEVGIGDCLEVIDGGSFLISCTGSLKMGVNATLQGDMYVNGVLLSPKRFMEGEGWSYDKNGDLLQEEGVEYDMDDPDNFCACSDDIYDSNEDCICDDDCHCVCHREYRSRDDNDSDNY